MKRIPVIDFEAAIVKKIAKQVASPTESNYEVVVYGLALFIETVFKVCLLILYAILIGRLKEVILFQILFFGLRSSMGGAHCRTNAGCTFTMFAVFTAGVVLQSLLPPDWITYLACLLMMPMILYHAPISTLNNPITDYRIRRKKKILGVIWFSLCVIVTASTPYNGYVLVVAVTVTVSCMIQIVVNRKTIKKTE